MPRLLLHRLLDATVFLLLEAIPAVEQLAASHALPSDGQQAAWEAALRAAITPLLVTGEAQQLALSCGADAACRRALAGSLVGAGQNGTQQQVFVRLGAPSCQLSFCARSTAVAVSAFLRNCVAGARLGNECRRQAHGDLH